MEISPSWTSRSSFPHYSFFGNYPFINRPNWRNLALPYEVLKESSFPSVVQPASNLRWRFQKTLYSNRFPCKCSLKLFSVSRLFRWNDAWSKYWSLVTGFEEETARHKLETVDHRAMMTSLQLTQMLLNAETSRQEFLGSFQKCSSLVRSTSKDSKKEKKTDKKTTLEK